VPEVARDKPGRHILIIEPENGGGMWHYAVSLSTALARGGFPVTLGTVFPFEELGTSGGADIRAIGVEMPPTVRQPMSLMRRAVGHLDRLNRVRRIVGELRPGVVHLHNAIGTLDFLYFRALRLWSTRVVYTAHDVQPLHREQTWLDWARYRAADAILVHSSRDVPVLLSKGIDESKISVIPHGNYLQYCPVALPPGRAKLQLGLPADARVVLFFGMISPYKGLDLLIEAFGRLSAARSDVWLVIAGAPGEDVAPYLRRIRELRLGDRVVLDLRYIPFDELPKFFSAADLVAFPYRRISQSGVLQLAYAYARPVVVTNVGGLAEAVEEDGTGVVAATPDPRAFASAMLQVLSAPDKAARMGERGRSLAQSKYSWDSIVEKIAVVYESVQPGVSAVDSRQRVEASRMGEGTREWPRG
jgi:D-inositol-3-phosphate glycosyltransferase